MYLHILFGQRKEGLESEDTPQDAPEPLLCWSEHQVSDNPSRFHAECDEVMRALERDFIAYRVCQVSVDADEIKSLLLETPTVSGALRVNFDKLQ